MSDFHNNVVGGSMAREYKIKTEDGKTHPLSDAAAKLITRAGRRFRDYHDLKTFFRQNETGRVPMFLSPPDSTGTK